MPGLGSGPGPSDSEVSTVSIVKPSAQSVRRAPGLLSGIRVHELTLTTARL